MMHVMAAQKNSALYVRNFIFLLDTANSSTLEFAQFFRITWTPLIHTWFSLCFSRWLPNLYTANVQINAWKKNVPMNLKRLHKSSHNEDKLLFHYNFLALMIHSYTCDNAQITGWRIILSWLMRLNFQKNWISSSLYHHIKMLWQYIYVSMTYRNV